MTRKYWHFQNINLSVSIKSQSWSSHVSSVETSMLIFFISFFMSHLLRPSLDKRLSTCLINIDIFKSLLSWSHSGLNLGLHMSHLLRPPCLSCFYFSFFIFFFPFLLFFSSSRISPPFLLFTTRMESLKEKGNRRKMSIGSESLSWSLYFSLLLFWRQGLLEQVSRLRG